MIEVCNAKMLEIRSFSSSRQPYQSPLAECNLTQRDWGAGTTSESGQAIDITATILGTVRSQSQTSWHESLCSWFGGAPK